MHNSEQIQLSPKEKELKGLPLDGTDIAELLKDPTSAIYKLVYNDLVLSLLLEDIREREILISAIESEWNNKAREAEFMKAQSSQEEAEEEYHGQSIAEDHSKYEQMDPAIFEAFMGTHGVYMAELYQACQQLGDLVTEALASQMTIGQHTLTISQPAKHSGPISLMDPNMVAHLADILIHEKNLEKHIRSAPSAERDKILAAHVKAMVHVATGTMATLHHVDHIIRSNPHVALKEDEKATLTNYIHSKVEDVHRKNPDIRSSLCNHYMTCLRAKFSHLLNEASQDVRTRTIDPILTRTRGSFFFPKTIAHEPKNAPMLSPKPF